MAEGHKMFGGGMLRGEGGKEYIEVVAGGERERIKRGQGRRGQEWKGVETCVLHV